MTPSGADNFGGNALALADAGKAAVSSGVPLKSFLGAAQCQNEARLNAIALSTLQTGTCALFTNPGYSAPVLLRKKLQHQDTLVRYLLHMGIPQHKAFGAVSPDNFGLNLLANNIESANHSIKMNPVLDSLQTLLQSPLPTARSRRGRIATFTQKMHEMLVDLENVEHGKEIATFLPHGRAFVILKPKEFAENVMPKYFHMGRFSSFQRQLNLYEFQRIKQGPDKGAYYHELFVRDNPALCKLMRRIKIKGGKVLNSRKNSL